MVVATGIGLASAYLGLLVSFHVSAPSGPAIVLAAGFCYLFSLALAKSIHRRRG
jgi:zinc/manganese transport system permease protein